MGVRKRGSALLAFVAVLALVAGCSPSEEGSGLPAEPTGLDVTSTTVTFEDTARTTSTGDGSEPLPSRTLETTIWYPTEGDGPFPLVVYSHGYRSNPEDYAELIETWAAAGMVVVAPMFPLTAAGTLELRTDLPSQPADVSFVLTQVLEMNDTAGSGIEGLIDPERIAAAGHSAGALTTALLFTDTYFDDRLDAAVVLAGGELSYLVPELGEQPVSTFVDSGNPMLFVHGGADDAIPLEEGELLYSFAPAPKAFLEAEFATHSKPYDDPADDSWAVIAAGTTGYLTWALDIDPDGLQRMRDAVEADGGAGITDDELT
jgi:fermentation-respiration switch protein FrsA (DUF1100 family)